MKIFFLPNKKALAISQFAFRGIHYGIGFQNTNVPNEMLENKIKNSIVVN